MPTDFGRIAAAIAINLGLAGAFFLLSAVAALAAGSPTGSASALDAGSRSASLPSPAARPPMAFTPSGGIEYITVPGGIVARVTFAVESGAPSSALAPQTLHSGQDYQLGVKTWVQGITVFWNGLCKDAEGGSWQEITPPQYGQASSTTITYPFTGCNAPMSVLYYTMTKTIPFDGEDYFDYEYINHGPCCSKNPYYAHRAAPYKQKCNCECPCAGNPFVIATGVKTETVTDYETSGPNKLGFVRYYNMYPGAWWIGQDSGTPAAVPTTLGRSWRSNFDRYLNLVSSEALVAERQGGQFLSFAWNGSGWAADSDVDVQLVQSGSTFTLTDTDDTVESYTVDGSGKGRLTQIRTRNGYAQNLLYDGSGVLQSVTDSYGRSLSFGYSNGLLASVTTPDGSVISYSYALSNPAATKPDLLVGATYATGGVTYLFENSDLPTALTGLVDENGNRFATWTYGSRGYIASSQHAGGADLTTVAGYPGSGVSVTNALGQKHSYYFSNVQDAPKLVEIDRYPTATTDEAYRLLDYDANGFLASESAWTSFDVYPPTIVTTYVNDARGQPTTITEAQGTPQQRVTQITYHPTFHLPVQIVASGLTTSFTYDASGNLTSRTETDTTTNTVPYSTNGQTRTWSYSWANSLPSAVTDPRGHTTQLGWDASGALVAITNALGQITQVAQHTAGGSPLTIVDPNGVVTNLAYDARQRLVSRTVSTAAGPLVTTYTYDAVGNLIQVTQPDGSALAYTYDAAHRLVATADLLGQHADYKLDALGGYTETDTLNNANTIVRKQSASFDALGRLLQVIGGVGQTTTYAYDANGNRTQVTDPLGRVTTSSFDPLDRLLQIHDPNGGLTAFSYDANDRPTNVSDPNGNITTYIYDGFGELIGQASPDSGNTVFYYDAVGNLVQRVDAAGIITNYAYDSLDRPVARSYPGNPAENVAFTYDEASGGFGVGRLTTVTDQVGTLKRAYDERGNIVGETRNFGGANLTTAYAYDAAGRITAITYPSGWTVLYGRDAAGRVSGVSAKAPGSNTSQPVATSILYKPFGPVRGLSYGNGIVETRPFDLDYRRTSVTDSGASTLQNLSYGYDAANNVRSIADGLTPANSQQFGYDALDRLIHAQGGYGRIDTSYDPVGNIKTQARSPGGGRMIATALNSFTYAPQGNRLASISQGSAPFRQFGYTATGNVAQDQRPNQTLALAYNQDNRLASVTKNGNPASYSYDAFGQRLGKAVPGATTLYQYGPGGALLEELAQGSSGAVPQRDYIYLEGRPIAMLVPATGALFFVHADRLGTPQLVTDSQQAVAWKGSYDPFGQAQILVNQVSQNLRLPGQYADQESGYYHNGARDYAAGLGRYLQSDPIGLWGGLNTYTYVGGNPVGRVDPTGLCALNLVDKSDPLYKSGEAFKNAGDDTYYIIAHQLMTVDQGGNFAGTYFLTAEQNGKPLTADDVARMVANDPCWHGQPIKIATCEAGKSEVKGQKRSLAQEFAEDLRKRAGKRPVEVWGSPESLYPYQGPGNLYPTLYGPGSDVGPGAPSAPQPAPFIKF